MLQIICLKNKIMNKTFLIVGSLVLVGAGVGVYFLIKPKSSSKINITNNGTPSIADVIAQQNELVTQTNALPPAGTVLTTPQQVKAVLDNTTKANDLAKAQNIGLQIDGLFKALPPLGSSVLTSAISNSCKPYMANTSILVDQTVYDCLKRQVRITSQYRDKISQLDALGYNYNENGAVTEKAK